MTILKKLGILALLFLMVGLIWLYEPDIPLAAAAEVLRKENSAIVPIKGMELHYTEEGSGEPVVLIHGTGGLLHTWDAWTSVLKQHYRVVRLDLPGFGLTGPSPDGDYSIDFYTEVLQDFCDSLQLDSFYLAGNSLGGQIAWEYALKHPHQVKKMILLAPAGVYVSNAKSTPVFKLAKINWLATLLQNFGTRFFVKKTLRDVYADPSRMPAGMENLYLTAAKREGNRAAFMARLQSQNPKSRLDEIATLGMPVLLQWGDSDVLIPHTAASKFQERLSRDTLIVYPNTGHVPMEEIPEQSVQDALQFLKN